MTFARCPGCSRWRTVVPLPHSVGYRTRRHGACGIVRLPIDVELRPL